MVVGLLGAVDHLRRSTASTAEYVVELEALAGASPGPTGERVFQEPIILEAIPLGADVDVTFAAIFNDLLNTLGEPHVDQVRMIW